MLCIKMVKNQSIYEIFHMTYVFYLQKFQTNFFFSFRMKFWDFRENVKFILDHMIRSGII
jgi:hypothetical protein